MFPIKKKKTNNSQFLNYYFENVYFLYTVRIYLISILIDIYF